MRAENVPKGSKSRITGRFITAILIVIIALMFVFSNLETGSVRFLGWEFALPIWIWLLVVLAAGVIAGSLFPWLRPRKRR